MGVSAPTGTGPVEQPPASSCLDVPPLGQAAVAHVRAAVHSLHFIMCHAAFACG